MKTRLGLFLVPLTLLISLLAATSASASAPYDVSLEPSAPTFGAGAEAMIVVHASGPDASAIDLDYAAEGGTVTGALSLNELGDGEVAGAVFVRRDTPGEVTVTASLDGAEVAQTTAEFVAGAPVNVELRLEAEPGAAARTWLFDVYDGGGRVRASVHVATSGDSTTGFATTAPLPYGEYTVRMAASRDAAASCQGGAFYSITPSDGVAVTVGPAGASAALTVRSCALPEPAEQVAGARTGEILPPATGNGQQEEKWELSNGQKFSLSKLLFVTIACFMLGVPLAHLLTKLAPVKWEKKKK